MAILFVKKLLFFCFLLLISALTSEICAEENPLNGLSNKYPRRSRLLAQEQLYDKGPQIIPILIQGLSDPDEFIRIECIRMLGAVKSKKAVPDLLVYLNNAKGSHGAAVCAFTLGQIKDKRAIIPLLDMVSSSAGDDKQRRAGLVALGLLQDKKALPVLESFLSSNNEVLQIFAAGSLGMNGSDKGFDVAIKGTASQDQSVRIHAIQALGLIGNKMALPTLNNLAIKTSSTVELQTIQLAKYQIEQRDLSNKEKISKIAETILMAKKPNVLTRWGLRELKNYANPRSRAALDEVIRDHKNGNIRSEAMNQMRILNVMENLPEEAEK